MDQKGRKSVQVTYDVLIIGAGVVGCAVARELSRYQLKVAVLEKESDVAAGTSGRNSAVIHAGFNNKPGSLMAELCVEGSQGFEELCAELDVDYKRTGKYLIAFDEQDLAILERLIRQGEANGVRGLRMAEPEEYRNAVPNAGEIGAMYSLETAIVNPFQYVTALAQYAAQNGGRFYFDEQVRGIEKSGDGYRVDTERGTFFSRCLVNSAGLHSGEIAAMTGVEGFRIYPCRGEYLILDKVASQELPIPIYPAPRAGIGGLGVHLTPTTNGNVIIGPSAEYIDDPEDYASTAPVMEKLWSEAVQLLPSLTRKQIIGSYCGNRAKLAPPSEGGFRDFVIQEFSEAPGAIQLIGIESPGLTASVPIARRVAGLLSKHVRLVPKAELIPAQKRKPRFRDLPRVEQDRLIALDPDYGEIVCRCEHITKREIKDAIESCPGLRTLSAIKYRCRASMGRCQGGYCLPRIADILIREYGMMPDEIVMRGKASHLFGRGFLREEV